MNEILIKHEVGKFFKNLKLQNAIILKANDMEKIIAYTSDYSLIQYHSNRRSC